MEKTPLPPHGGDLAYAGQIFGIPAEGWLDLSTGINPRPYPVGKVPPHCWNRLPERAAEDDLRQAAHRFYGTPSPACVVAAPGTQALIQTLPRLMAGKSAVSVLGPTYEEHAKAWKMSGHPIRLIRSLKEEETKAPILVVVTPNNPDGRFTNPKLLEDEANTRALLVVDEAFIDLTPERSLTSKLPANTIILRSFGKFFGLAGVRLGFALARPALAEKLAEFLGPWAVSGPTLEIGTQALSDVAWSNETRNFLTSQAAALDQLLKDARLDVVGGTALFRLIRTPHARRLYNHLAQHGILVRAFTHTPDALRFGLPADEHEMLRLAKVLGLFTP